RPTKPCPPISRHQTRSRRRRPSLMWKTMRPIMWPARRTTLRTTICPNTRTTKRKTIRKTEWPIMGPTIRRSRSLPFPSSRPRPPSRTIFTSPRMQPAGDLARHPTPIPLHLQDGLPADDDEPDYARPPRSYGGLVKILVLLLIVGIVGGVAYWQRGPLTQLVAGLTRKSPPQGQQQAAQPSGRPKITDRV